MDLSNLDPLYLVYGLAALAAVLLAEAVYLMMSGSESYRKRVNRRLRLLSDQPDREAALIQLRRERGLTGEGFYLLPLKAFNRLVLQSGVTVGVWRIVVGMAVMGIAAGCVAFAYTGRPDYAAAAVPAGGLVVPVFVLRFLRKRRMNRFAQQFPDAIDMIVRSLKAGHPVPTAISLVAREMPDPVGSEFGMLADEVTYGSDLETAMRNLLYRVGQEDLALFVTAVAIQGSTGGNLSKILENLSKVIRERFKMRRKIRALSSEGRFSALALSAMPIGLFLIVNYANPEFYGSVWHIPMTRTALGVAGAWMAFGNVMMMRMCNFRI